MPLSVGEYISDLTDFPECETRLIKNDYDYAVVRNVYWSGQSSEDAIKNISKHILFLHEKSQK